MDERNSNARREILNSTGITVILYGEQPPRYGFFREISTIESREMFDEYIPNNIILRSADPKSLEHFGIIKRVLRSVAKNC